MLKEYFISFRNEIIKVSSGRCDFWNCMTSYFIGKDPPWEIITLPIVKSIEELFPGKYKSRYFEGHLDVLAIGLVKHGTCSDECADRFSIIWNFDQYCIRSEAIMVVDRAIELCERYEKLIPFS